MEVRLNVVPAPAWRLPRPPRPSLREPSESGQKSPSAKAIAKPSKPKAEKKSPTDKDGKLRAQHFAIREGWGARRSGPDLEGIVAEIAQIAKRYSVRTVHGDRYSRDWVAQAFGRHGLRYDSDHGLDKTAAYLETEPLFAQGRIAILDDATQRRELVCLERRPRPGNKATVDHPSSAGARDDYANALALAAAVASKKPGRPMFAGWGDRAKREPEKSSMPPASEPYIPGIGVVRVGSAPFYWTHENCGTQRLVDPSVEREPYRCTRCQPNWTGLACSIEAPFCSAKRRAVFARSSEP